MVQLYIVPQIDRLQPVIILQQDSTPHQWGFPVWAYCVLQSHVNNIGEISHDNM
jgi:hypothetical protein